MVRRSETFGTTGRVTAARIAKEAARTAARTMVVVVDTEVDDDFPELNR